ncbi:hypothetical protein ACP0AK_13250 [Listeria ivanovii]|nr:hypothetical protein [Listeria ivanovii]AHI57324.1 hypothetical protein AX25_14010 [Listeria ivanovii WSLC3009]MBK3914897.1 hypothetical protein [Listeria ivanovii subsp. ivanovii]MBK3921942.1 hypothetical protein [Listeria ivanovii subsp. ivanovii]MBK3927186.1 hypothetical protein [Listeria ivanovii subsp. ivanovii]MCJ1717840.1 hypothetical protein [Listeria ivanovii]
MQPKKIGKIILAPLLTTALVTAPLLSPMYSDSKRNLGIRRNSASSSIA